MKFKGYEPVVNNALLDFPADMTIGGSAVVALATITSSSANALTAGANGTTGPAFNVDASTASQADGFNVQGLAAGNGVAVSTITTGTNSPMKIDAAGTGVITASSVSTGGFRYLGALVTGSGATVSLTAAQSGNRILFDRAAGIVFTLPIPQVGIFYDFFIKTTITSNSAKVITDAGSTFIAGFISSGVDNTANKQWIGNGTTHVAITQNGSTTGGIIGGSFRLTCVSATLWIASGTLVASGTPATPFATS